VSRKAQLEKVLEHLRSGNMLMAAELCDASLKRYPGDAQFLCLSARANLAMRNFTVAAPRVEEAIRRFPDFATAHETYGDLQLVRGHAKEALTAYETAVRLDPTNPVIHDKIERARTVLQNGSAAPATPRARRRMRFSERIASARQAEQAGDLQSAEMIYREILTKDPDHVEAARLLAGIAVQNERFREAEVFLKRAIANAPDYTRAWVDLSHVQRELDRFGDAAESARRVLELEPDNPNSHILYGSAIGTAGDHEGAIESFRTAIDMSPDKPGAICGMAHHQKTLGEQDAAIANYRRAIEVKPDHAEAYWSLANLKTFRFRDDEVEAMQRLLGREDLPDESRAQLQNALGLEFEARQDYDRAFEHFAACNAVRRQHETYDPVDTESTYDRLINLFTPQFFEKHAGVPDASVTPILVVGLPRSGSTLIEQILASHSRVDGTHELGDLSRAVRAVRGERSRRERFPDMLDKFDQDDWRRIGEEYLERTKIFRSGAPFFVDKNPNNFVYAGVLKLAIPNAKIINARRHPLDSCFGSFKQLFASGQPFTYDLVELGEYYLQYERLMHHWHEVLPGFVLDVHYEQVVADLEAEVKQMLDFCGLPLEDACLRFYETERAVKTASSEQVRQPIYSSSVDLWRNYEAHLSELIHILKPLLDARPGADRPGEPAPAQQS
jgi:tetratricopeptide (TPR) repeat protein